MGAVLINKTVENREGINTICDYLGNYLEYDAECNKYEWESDEIELVFYNDERIYFDML